MCLPFLLLFTSLDILRLIWGLTFLNLSLHAQTVSPYSSWSPVPASTSCVLYCYVWVQLGPPSSPCGPCATFGWFPAHSHGPFLSLEGDQPALLDHLLSRTASRGILPSRTLNRPKPPLLKSRGLVLLFSVFLPVRILGVPSLLSCIWSVWQQDLSTSHGAGPSMAHRAVKEQSLFWNLICL